MSKIFNFRIPKNVDITSLELYIFKPGVGNLTLYNMYNF